MLKARTVSNTLTNQTRDRPSISIVLLGLIWAGSARGFVWLFETYAQFPRGTRSVDFFSFEGSREIWLGSMVLASFSVVGVIAFASLIHKK